jgi:hypothetical protein
MKKRLLCLPAIVMLFCCSTGNALAASGNAAAARTPDFVIIDSWLTGYISGFFSTKEKRFKAAWKEGRHRAANDAKIWGGLFVSDTNRSGAYRLGEVISRFTYQAPQTAGGFLTAQFYNTIAGKVNTVEYGFGATALNMRVSWSGVALGNYILARKTIHADPNNRLFQHEYGHYLQSKRMGLAYFVRVGLPAIMSKGDHDAHPVEIDCNREGFLYFNRYVPQFLNDSLIADKKGWDFYYNPFPAGFGDKRAYRDTTLQYIDYRDSLEVQRLQELKVRATFIDYAGWIAPPLPVAIGLVHAKRYNKKIEEQVVQNGQLTVDN